MTSRHPSPSDVEDLTRRIEERLSADSEVAFRTAPAYRGTLIRRVAAIAAAEALSGSELYVRGPEPPSPAEMVAAVNERRWEEQHRADPPSA